MIQWKQHGCTEPVFSSECGLFVIYRTPRREIVVKRYDTADAVKPFEVSGPLPTIEAAKQWAEDRVPVFTL